MSERLKKFNERRDRVINWIASVVTAVLLDTVIMVMIWCIWNTISFLPKMTFSDAIGIMCTLILIFVLLKRMIDRS